MSRDQILARIRTANASLPEDRYEDVPRPYAAAASPETARPEDRADLFAERLADYNATVHRCGPSPQEIRATIARALASRGISRILVPAGIPGEWLPGQEDGNNSLTFERDSGQFTYDELDRAPGVLTGCAVAIALTGTIVLHHQPDNGRRALTLIPDYHLCVVRTSQLVATVPEGLRRMAALDSPRLLTTISGPSATSDIEMTRVKGVHGPRVLEVILVEDAVS